MRPAVVSIIALIVVMTASGSAAASDTQLVAALRLWRPNLFGAGSVVRGPLDIATVDREGLDAVRSCQHCPQVPFGYMNRYWRQFKRQIRPSDSLVFFRSDTKSWSGLYGRQGYAIVRDGKVVKVMIGVLS